MKKFIHIFFIIGFFVLIFFVCYFYINKVRAQVSPPALSVLSLQESQVWSRYNGNPVLSKSTTPSWDDLVAYAPKILKNSDGSPYVDSQGNYYLYYTGSGTLAGLNFDQSGLALSKDLLHWTRYGSNPVLPRVSGSTTAGDASAVSIIKDGNIFYMWHEGNSNMNPSLGDNVTINVATSVDGKVWTEYAANPVLSQGSGSDNYDLYAPVVIKDGSTWKMWYTGHDSADSFGLMYATALSPQGPWTKYSSNYIWQTSGSFFPSEVWKDGGQYYMIYMNYTSQHPFDELYLASSPDGINWTEKGIIFKAAGGNGWDGWQVRWPSQVKVGDTWYTFYDGSDPLTYSIGVATSSARVSSVFLVPTPISTLAISSPINGATVTSRTIVVSGTCDPTMGSVFIAIGYDTGTGSCSSSNSYSIPISFTGNAGNIAIGVRYTSGGSYVQQISIYFNPGSMITPTPPTLTGATNYVCGQLRLDYTDNSNNEDGFRVWRKAGSSSAPYNSSNGWINISDSTQPAWPGTGTQRPYVDPTYNGPAGSNPPTGNTGYYYVVEVYNSAGSNYTNIVSGVNVPCGTSTPTPPPAGILKGDLNKDGIVNSLDWSLMNSKWFTNDATADLNSDGIVNSLDFSIMNSNWLKSG